MEMKQINLNSKSTINDKSIKRLIDFVHHLEEKLLSVKITHDRLNELMSIVSKTHENILQDLTNIKTFLNEKAMEQEADEIIPIDPSKSEWNDDDEEEEDEQIKSKKLNENILEKVNSLLSNDSSSISKRLSNLKKSDQSSSRIKSPKSVTFSLGENLSNPQPKRIIPIFEPFTKEKKNQFTTLIHLSSSSDHSKQNQSEKPPKVQRTLTSIRIHEIESKNGDYLRLLNVSNSDDYDLSEHFLQQNIHSKPFCRFQFPSNTIIKAGQTLTIWCGGRAKDIIPKPPYVLIWKEQTKWETKPECITILAKPNGQSIALYKNSHRIITDQSSSDILHIHTKATPISSDVSSSNNVVLRSNKIKYRLPSLNFFGSTKPPFAHSPNNPIHPNHNGTIGILPNDLRSQINQKNKTSQLLNRPKSSPFASHMGCKQDLISLNLLQTQKQTTIKN